MRLVSFSLESLCGRVTPASQGNTNTRMCSHGASHCRNAVKAIGIPATSELKNLMRLRCPIGARNFFIPYVPVTGFVLALSIARWSTLRIARGLIWIATWNGGLVRAALTRLISHEDSRAKSKNVQHFRCSVCPAKESFDLGDVLRRERTSAIYPPKRGHQITPLLGRVVPLSALLLGLKPHGKRITGVHRLSILRAGAIMASPRSRQLKGRFIETRAATGIRGSRL